MATLLDLHGLVIGSSELEARFQAARYKAATAIKNESPSTTNHAARLAWAEGIISDYGVDLDIEYRLFLANPTIQQNGLTSSDSDIEYVVNTEVVPPSA